MPRKANKWRPLARNIHRRIVAIDRVDVADCTCITVAADDGLFVTEHCIVTHNSQAIRTKSRELQFSGLESDRAKSRGALPDYLLKFRTRGENAIPVLSKGSVTREDWIRFAECCWTDIKETDTLNVREGRGEKDTKHICPLQLGVIDRLVKLFTNDNETVFSPFAGIGSEGYMAIKNNRRFYGCELKLEYHVAAMRNLQRAVESIKSEQLFFSEMSATA